MCVLRGGKEEQTPGASVSGLRPWRQSLAALTEVATNADVQTPPRARAHTHTLTHTLHREEQNERKKQRKRQRVRCISGKLMNSGRGWCCFSAFSDRDVFICTDQKPCGGDINIVMETLLTGLFHAPHWVGVTVHSMGRCHTQIKI